MAVEGGMVDSGRAGCVSVSCSRLLAALLKIDGVLEGQKTSIYRHWRKRGFSSVEWSLFARRPHTLSDGASFSCRDRKMQDGAAGCVFQVSVAYVIQKEQDRGDSGHQ